MFVLSWIRSADAQAARRNDSASEAVATTTNHDSTQAQSSGDSDNHEDWVVLPSDYQDLMEASVSNLELLSPSSMTLYSPKSPVAAHSTELVTSTTKSRRQLKQEHRLKLAQEQLERKPRYDPFTAKLRDTEFKMRKLARLSLRTGRVLSSSTGGAHSAKGQSAAGATGSRAGASVC
ncbi:hypothetical protein BGW38_009111 [Lunasporangiospora selenospora]|uniref:Uncharacterized protein n=1 Tax=Lunasporangiospora selenospora TaxID=979761 RepID=A0A9P6KGB0_9FUNG|nr:hypothetical protein BGW38_009111 [Lunasporangiospora selenospora]